MIFSLEMSKEQITNRLISMMTRIPAQSLKSARRRYLTQQQQAAVMEAAGRIADLPLNLSLATIAHFHLALVKRIARLLMELVDMKGVAYYHNLMLGYSCHQQPITLESRVFAAMLVCTYHIIIVHHTVQILLLQFYH
jgi:hypothetical protein